jgi:predicted HicB family RNase H-like nuclease
MLAQRIWIEVVSLDFPLGVKNFLVRCRQRLEKGQAAVDGRVALRMNRRFSSPCKLAIELSLHWA